MKALRLVLCVAAILLLASLSALGEGGGPVVLDAGAPEAYMNDTSLTEVIISKDSPGIGARAFMGCKNLTSVTIPYGVWYIGEDAFAGCEGLTIYALDLGTEEDEQGHVVANYARDCGIAFEDRRQVDPSGLEYVIDEGECSIVGYRGEETELDIPAELEGCPVVRISLSAFDEYEEYNMARNPDTENDPRLALRLRRISIPGTVREICDSAFQCCEKLETVDLAEGLERIEVHAFYTCRALKELHIPSTVRSIQGNPFAYCTGMTGLSVAEGNPFFAVVDGVLYSADGTRLICYPCQGQGRVDVPFGVREIAAEAFANCASLSEIRLPVTLTSIEADAFQGCQGVQSFSLPASLERMEGNPFNRCRGLESFEVDEDNRRFRAQDGVLLDGDMSRLICAPATMEDGYAAPDTLEEVGDYAFFRCAALTSVRLPQSVRRIGEHAFEQCEALASVALQEGVTDISDSAFAGCASLATLRLPQSVVRVADNAFEGCDGLTLVGEADSVAEKYAVSQGIAFNVARLPIGAEAGYSTLRRGDRNDEVKALQQKLIDLGFLTGKADGDYGRKTADAVSAFQRSVGLAETGEADPETQALLFAQ